MSFSALKRFVTHSNGQFIQQRYLSQLQKVDIAKEYKGGMEPYFYNEFDRIYRSKEYEWMRKKCHYAMEKSDDLILETYPEWLEKFQQKYPKLFDPKIFTYESVQHLLKTADSEIFVHTCTVDPGIILHSAIDEFDMNLTKKEKSILKEQNYPESNQNYFGLNDLLLNTMALLSSLVNIGDERIELYCSVEEIQNLQDICTNIFHHVRDLSDPRNHSEGHFEAVFSEISRYHDICSTIMPPRFWYTISQIFYDMHYYAHVHGPYAQIWCNRLISNFNEWMEGSKKEGCSYTGCYIKPRHTSIDQYMERRTRTTGHLAFLDFLGLIHVSEIDDQMYQKYIVQNDFYKYGGILSGMFNDLAWNFKDEKSYKQLKAVVGDTNDPDLIKTVNMAKHRYTYVRDWVTWDDYYTMYFTTKDIIQETLEETRITCDEQTSMKIFAFQVMSLLSSVGVNFWQLNSRRYHK